MGFGMIELLVVLLSGGGWGNDLLDYLPTNAYWRTKGVEVSAERMAAELAPGEPAEMGRLVRDLGAADFATREAASKKLRTFGPTAIPALEKAAASDDPEVRTRAREILKGLSGGARAMAVRRLMAIRTLGELKKPQALPTLRALLKSKEPFVADYAQRAIAAIQGKPHQRPQATKEQAWSDVCLLPPKCGIVVQVRMPGAQAVPFEEALRKLIPTLPMGQDTEKLIAEVASGVGSVAERVGNIRLDTLTIGVAENVGDRKGFVVVVARGFYDAKAAKAALKQMNVAVVDMHGIEALQPDNEVRLVLLSNDRFVFVAGPSSEQLPLEEVAAALKAQPDKPALGAAMLELIKTIAPASSAWAAVTMSDAYRQAPFLAPFDTITAAGKPTEDKALAVTVTAVGKDPEAVKKSVETVRDAINEGLAEIRQEAERMPFLKPIVEFMESIRIETVGAKATLTARLKGQGAVPMLLMPMFLFSARSAPAPPAQLKEAPVQVAPAPRPAPRPKPPAKPQ